MMDTIDLCIHPKSTINVVDKLSIQSKVSHEVSKQILYREFDEIRSQYNADLDRLRDAYYSQFEDALARYKNRSDVLPEYDEINISILFDILS